MNLPIFALPLILLVFVLILWLELAYRNWADRRER